MTTHVYNPKLGFQQEVDQRLHDEMKIETLADWQKFVGLVFDEMRVKEGIVYDKFSCEILGFINLGSVTNQLLEFERSCGTDDKHTENFPVAKYINCFMMFVPVCFPYAQFATTADQLFLLVWETVKRLKLKVVFITCDGASANCKFFKMNGARNKELMYKTLNIYTEEKQFIFCLLTHHTY